MKTLQLIQTHSLQIPLTADFSVTDLERLCPNVSRDMIRHLLRNLKEQGIVTCVGRGPGAKWRKEGNTP